MVTGPPASICAWNMVATEPLLPKTLPNRTATNLVPELRPPGPVACISCKELTICSAALFVMPSTERVHRLVARNEQELRNPALSGNLRADKRSENVCLDCRFPVFLEQRDVLSAAA